MIKHTHEKNVKIITELMNFCYKHGGTNFHIDLSTEDKKICICIESEIYDLKDETLESSKNLLNCPRCHEVEQYYWNLTGNDISDNELSLVGMMIDKAEINYDNKTLKILVIREE
ncbi:hypothetical protein ACER0A_000385 [Haloimpatiens sp. FM7315]|uniref:hypothetical protein n=1 Tax=Haloimpatiens sp. FM7315 TaxID=3298609 RepID=UPI0035A352CC